MFVSLQYTTQDQEETCNGSSVTGTNKDWRLVSDLCIDSVVPFSKSSLSSLRMVTAFSLKHLKNAILQKKKNMKTLALKSH